MSQILALALLVPPYMKLYYSATPHLPKEYWQIGLRVAVPLGERKIACPAVVLECNCDPANVPVGVILKNVIWGLEKAPILSASYLAMIHQLAVRQMQTDGQVLGMLLPSSLRTTQVRFRVRDGGRGKSLLARNIAHMTEDELAQFATAWQNGNVSLELPLQDEAKKDICHIMQDPPWAIRPNAKSQLELMEYLWNKGACSRRSLLQALGTKMQSTLNTLIEHKLVRIAPPELLDMDKAFGELTKTSKSEIEEALQDQAPYTLTEAQAHAVQECTASMQAKNAASYLLFGITGSGKTAVYMELVKNALHAGRSVLLLAPEIALACKLQHDVEKRFPRLPVMLYHGYQSAAERELRFRAVAENETHGIPQIIVGTRSALFLPLQNIGAIVLDEEHDSSFKQDERLNYQAKEVAWFRIAQSRGVLVLGSATPDIKSFQAVQTGQMQVLELTERVGGGTLPQIELVDMRKHAATEHILAAPTLERLKETVARGEQAVVLLNRRGYAPLMYCLDCGTVAHCPHCDIGLTYHKGRERLVCHYCGYSEPFPSPCAKCKSLHFLPMGEGTERLEETLASILPNKNSVLRLDHDSTRRQGRMEAILQAFEREEAQVLVGTQMLSKGHHFPSVTLAIVADGDLGLNMPDYRATERTFQLLVQAAGRAGRGEKAGTVLIQTRDPKHYCWDFIRNCDYTGFFAHELALRQKRKYPPFIKLALIRISYALDWQEGQKAVQDLAKSVQDFGRAHGIQVLGPAPAPLAMLRGRKRFHCLVKGHDWAALRTLYAKVQAEVSPKLRVTLDIDPVNML